ncbi:HAD family hydrolase [Pseudomonas citronellolis]|uniref:HAD family hydrolase n=1 Tax=Pseudomonas citronellolis TaxID=53408 RepID=UPI00209DF405|nr:ATPase P [Pseudomonas citronellolis]MCP1603741.1 soluble P-type ATPase [Pseudomonas citronellolis]MCP1657898.1 soluble P-type ATPase [Pseudomonas citronellolis]MCP1724819.1 soluble P-type ATPase [Pseudomonas citronellolis]
MLQIDIPGLGSLQLKHMICDYNGTLAVDGRLIDGVAERLQALGCKLALHVVTGDTFGSAEAELAALDVNLLVLSEKDQAISKEDYLRTLGLHGVVAIGNGSNDRYMLQQSALGIAVIGPEGASSVAIGSADLVALDILSALDMLTHPQRIIASLRC